MALVDEVRMDRSVISVVTTETPSGAKDYWKTRTMEERLAALELTRQIMNAYDPDTTRFQRVLEVARCPRAVPADRAYAVNAYGYVRNTDLENLRRVIQAIRDFGFPAAPNDLLHENDAMVRR
jgi:hypothetical protein